MASYYNRVCLIEISPDIVIRDLKIFFEVKKSIDAARNSARVDIYNLSQTTRNNITNDINSLVRISAGYVENTGLLKIGQGNISNVLHQLKSPDIITTIYTRDGFSSLRNSNISLSFVDKTPLSDIISLIAKKLNLPISYANYDKSIKIKNGFSFVGSTQDVLDKLAQQYNFKWSIQNGEIVIIKENSSTNRKVVFLSASTGLVENPEKIIKTKNLDELVRHEYRVVSLLQPQLEVGDLVEIDSKTLKGVYVIIEIVHKGDTRGNDWYSTLTVRSK